MVIRTGQDTTAGVDALWCIVSEERYEVARWDGYYFKYAKMGDTSDTDLVGPIYPERLLAVK